MKGKVIAPYSLPERIVKRKENKDRQGQVELFAATSGQAYCRRMTYLDISPAQERVLVEIKKFTEKNRQSPTYPEVAAELGITSKAVAFHVGLLEKKGYLVRRPGIRNISLSDKAL
ncbi:MAG: LexA family protein [Pirellulales bacterium]